MRVGVGFYGLGPEGGGVHTFQRTLLDALREAEAESRHEFIYYSAGGAADDRDVIEVPTHGVHSARRRALELMRQAQDRLNVPRSGRRTWLERSLDANRIEFMWFAANWAQDCGRPFLFTLFDLGHLVQPHFPEVSADGEWERRQEHFTLMRKASGVIVPNIAGRDQLLRHIPVEAERVFCLGHPTPDFALHPERYTIDADAIRRLGVQRPYLFYPAQFWAHKNHYNLLRALCDLDGYDLVLVGSDKGQESHVRSMVAQLGVGDRVRFCGFVDTPTLIALYQGAHALVYPSFLGPENLPPLEACALGCPVVAADVPGAAEQLADAGLLVPPTDPEAMAAAVRRLEETDVRVEHIARGRQVAAAATVDRYVAGVLSFLDEFEPIRRCWA